MAAQALQNSKIAVPKLWRVRVRSSRLHTQGSRDIFSNLFPYSLFVDHESNQDTPCPSGSSTRLRHCDVETQRDIVVAVPSAVPMCTSSELREGAAVLLLLRRWDAGQVCRVPPCADAEG